MNSFCAFVANRFLRFVALCGYTPLSSPARKSKQVPSISELCSLLADCAGDYKFGFERELCAIIPGAIPQIPTLICAQ